MLRVLFLVLCSKWASELRGIANKRSHAGGERIYTRVERERKKSALVFEDGKGALRPA